MLAYSAVGFEISADSAGCTGRSRSSENLEMKSFEKFENAIFFKIFKIPSVRQLIVVSNLTKIFFEKKFQQIRSLELSKIWAEMGRCGQAN